MLSMKNCLKFQIYLPIILFVLWCTEGRHQRLQFLFAVGSMLYLSQCWFWMHYQISTWQIFSKSLMVCPSCSCLVVVMTLLPWGGFGMHSANVLYPFPFPSFADLGYSHRGCPLIEFIVGGSVAKIFTNLTQTVRLEDI